MKALATQRSCSQRGLAFWLQDFLGRTVLSEHRGSEAISITAAWPAPQTWLPCGRSNGCSPGSLHVPSGAGEGEASGAGTSPSRHAGRPAQAGWRRGGLCRKGPFLWNQHIV